MPLRFQSTLDDSSFNRSLKRMEAGVAATAARIGQAFSSIGGGGIPALGILGGGGAAASGVSATVGVLYGVAKAGDQAANAIARLNVATGNQQEGLRIFDELKGLAKETGLALEQTSAQFARFAIAGRQIGATNDEVLTLIKLMGQAGVISGSTTEEAGAAAVQLGQALASGKFQGDELRSIMENMPILAEALAEKLGVSVGRLREMGKEGELTTDKVFPALLSAADEINAKFQKMPVSLSRAFGVARAQMAELLADWDRRLGVKDKVASTATGILPAAQRLAEVFVNRYLTPRAPGLRNVPAGAVTEGPPAARAEAPRFKFGSANPGDIGAALADSASGASSAFGTDFERKLEEANRQEIKAREEITRQLEDLAADMKMDNLRKAFARMEDLRSGIQDALAEETNFNLMGRDEVRDAMRGKGRQDRAKSRAERELAAERDPSRKFKDARFGGRDIGGNLVQAAIDQQSIDKIVAGIERLVAAP